MKRLFSIVAFCLLLSTAHSVSAQKTIEIATDVWIPYENLSNKEAPGFSTEVIRLVFSTLGQKIEIKEYPWARAVSLIQDGQSAGLFTAFYSEERAGYAYFPEEPLTRDKWIFFIRKKDVGRLSFSSYEDLKGKRIGVLRGASVSKEFWDFANEQKNFETVTADDANFKKLVAGRLDYVVTTFANGMSIIKSSGLADDVVPLTQKSIQEDNVYLIFSKKATTPEFVSSFSNALKKAKQTDQYKEIYKKYFN